MFRTSRDWKSWKLRSWRLGHNKCTDAPMHRCTIHPDSVLRLVSDIVIMEERINANGSMYLQTSRYTRRSWWMSIYLLKTALELLQVLLLKMCISPPSSPPFINKPECWGPEHHWALLASAPSQCGDPRWGLHLATPRLASSETHWPLAKNDPKRIPQETVEMHVQNFSDPSIDMSGSTNTTKIRKSPFNSILRTPHCHMNLWPILSWWSRKWLAALNMSIWNRCL